MTWKADNDDYDTRMRIDVHTNIHKKKSQMFQAVKWRAYYHCQSENSVTVHYTKKKKIFGNELGTPECFLHPKSENCHITSALIQIRLGHIFRSMKWYFVSVNCERRRNSSLVQSGPIRSGPVQSSIVLLYLIFDKDIGLSFLISLSLLFDTC
jgi:hypothetical protein